MPDQGRAHLFDADLWRPALERYGAVTHLTVSLYDTNQRLVGDPLPSTPLFECFRRYGYEPGILSDCARQCLQQPSSARAVHLSRSYGLAAVGTPLAVDGEIVGAAVAGYALVDFCRSSSVAALAHQAGIPFAPVWRTVLHLQPVTERRLITHGDLLNVVTDTILREHERTRQYQAVATDLEGRVAERTRELAFANQSLAGELQQRTEAEARIRGLLARLVVVQEQEQHRIARDVHDHLGQLLTALKLRLEVLETKPVGSPTWREQLAHAQDLVRRLDVDLTSFTRGLRPLLLDDFGLAPALASFLEDWSRDYSIEARFDDGLGCTRLGADVEINLFRIAQEALNNVHKHASASSVDVRLKNVDRAVVLSVEDDGTGFEPADADTERIQAMGLIGMRERATLIRASFDLYTTKGRGTRVVVAVPHDVA